MSIVANGKGLVAPISIEEIMTVLNDSKYDDVGNLCISAKICKFAKHKPVRAPELDTFPDTYKSVNGNCGLVPPEFFTNRTSAISGLKAGTVIWDYERPRGGADVFRMSDFDGYLHDSPNPFGELRDTTINDADNVIIAATPPNTSNTDYLTLSDFTNPKYDDWYFGILLVGIVSGRSYMATADSALGSVNGWQVNFGKINAESYTAIPFISSKKWIIGQSDPADVMVAGIENTGVTVIVQSIDDIYIVNIRCYFTSANVLHYEASIRNTSNSNRTFNNVTLRIAHTQQGVGNKSIKSFGTISVAPGSSWADSGDITVTGTANPSTYYQWCSLYYAGRGDKWVTILATPSVPES